ncbi:UNVERIFIED_CONTAM: hypothetical protein FKN15_032862 [Acipenser sinensis]
MQMEKAQERQKKQYRSRIKRGTKCFRIEGGMEVRKKNELKTGRLGSKLEQNWLGPYRVTEVMNNLVKLESLDGKKLKMQTPYVSVKQFRMGQKSDPLQNTTIKQITPNSGAQGFVQILNVSGNHWVTVVSLLQYSGKTIRIVWPHVQQQQGCSDCGLFTIANILTLCMSGDPDGSLPPFLSCDRTPLPELDA